MFGRGQKTLFSLGYKGDDATRLLEVDLTDLTRSREVQVVARNMQPTFNEEDATLPALTFHNIHCTAAGEVIAAEYVFYCCMLLDLQLMQGGDDSLCRSHRLYH